MNLWLSSFGQVNLVSLIEEGEDKLQAYLKQHPSREWTKNEFVQLYELFKQADYSKKNKLIRTLGYNFMLRALDVQVIFKARKEDDILENLEILERFRTRLKQDEKWNDWAEITIQLARNSYFVLTELLDIGRYYDELMENWEYLDLRLKIKSSGCAGNHFMGVEQNFEKAATYYEKVVKLEGIEERSKVLIYSGLAELYLRKKDFDRSLEYSNKILSTDSLNSFLKLQELIRCGNAHKEFGNLIEAENYFSQVEKTLPRNLKKIELNSFLRVAYINVYTGLLKIQLQRKNLAKAKIYNDKLEESLPILMKEGQALVLVLESLMEYNLVVNETDQFLILEEITVNLMNRQGARFAIFAPILTLRGDYWFKKKNAKLALALYDEALSLLKSSTSEELKSYTQDAPHALVTLTKKLHVLHWQQQQGQIKKGNRLFYETTQEAVHLLDHVRQNLSTKSAKLKILNSAPKIYEYALEATWDLYQETKSVVYLEKVYTLIERSKSMLLLEALNENSAKDFGGVPKELRTKEKNLINDLKLYQAKLIKAETRKNEANIATFRTIIFEKRNLLDKLKKQLEVEYPKYYALKFKANIAPLSEVQLALKANEAQFISYFLGERNLYICSMNGDDIDLRIEALPNNFSSNLEQDIFVLRSKLARIADIKLFNQEEYQSLINLSHRLYLLLLKDETKTVERLILSLDGLLHYIPFEVLITEKVNTTNINFKGLPYVMKDYVLSYNYTATLWLKSLELSKSLKANEMGVLGMAADYKNLKTGLSSDRMNLRKGLSELAGAKKEVSSLKKTYKGQFYIGTSATEAQFREDVGKYNIIHLALHGLVDNRIPMNSGLFFTEDGAENEDNVLFAYELSGLNLNANLVVLSACSTGDGTYKKGEGVLSLGRGFMYAGASSIMTTLWQINDQSSQEIMQHFYENLSKGIEKDRALQQAKLTYLEGKEGILNHPVFWAAFVLIGDIDHVVIDKQSQGLWALLPILGGILLLGGWFVIRRK